MWKKKENDPPTPEPIPRSEPPTARPAARPAATPRRTERAIIGPTLRIRGEISGEEELLVQGEVDGKIVVKGQGVSVGKSGKVRANIHARTIRVEGKVRGDLFGEHEVIIETSGDVEGNLIAPSVRLENGARFKGSIDMEQSKKPIPAAAPPMSAPTGLKPAATNEGGKGEISKSSPGVPGRPILRS